MSNSIDEAELLRAKLNGETSRMPWRELLRFFAGGGVIVVQDGLDLVEVALRIAQDDTAAVAAWMQSGALARASDEQALQDAQVWAVVVKPWVLVQHGKGSGYAGANADAVPSTLH